jgi:hypothetical protein
MRIVKSLDGLMLWLPENKRIYHMIEDFGGE